MVHVLGVSLPDHYLARLALTNFHGIGQKTAHRLCARLQIHDRCKVRSLSANQITELASFLASPSTAVPPPRLPLASTNLKPSPASTSLREVRQKIGFDTLAEKAKNSVDPLRNLKIETDLRRQVRENIAHQRMIGSYVGKRHAMRLPVRGQNTQTNAKTARKLNKLDRR